MWGSIDQSNNAPKFPPFASSNATGEDMFANVTINAFGNGVAMGVFGVSDSEAANTSKPSVASPGWTLVTWGTGPVSGFTIEDGGTGYANSEYLRVSGGSINAIANLTTNSTGGITNLTFTQYGAGFTNQSAATLAFPGTSGTDANITLTFGGRAGRIQTETLVAISNMTGTDSDSGFVE